MQETASAPAELPDLFSLLAQRFPHNQIFQYLHEWQHISYSLLVIFVVGILAYVASRKSSLIPGRLQSAAEALVGGVDDFVCGILGAQGRRFTPFIGTLFIYILFMNLTGLIPFIKSSTASWSTTMALALCVFVYVQYVGFKELGFLGYLDHLAGSPRGILAITLVFPIFMFCLHIITELVRPISLSLRLRGNIWGDEMLLSILAGLGIKVVPLLLFNMIMAILTGIVQAVVFCLLSTIYFALILTHEEKHA